MCILAGTRAYMARRAGGRLREIGGPVVSGARGREDRRASGRVGAWSRTNTAATGYRMCACAHGPVARHTDAAVSAIESHTYFVAPGSGLNNAGSTPRSLWRKSGLQPPVELVEGVEDLQILYGVDTDNDQAPNQYLPANLVIDWRQLTTLIVTVVVNSIDDTGGTTMSSAGCPVPAGCAVDGLQRRTFTQTFQLRNHG